VTNRRLVHFPPPGKISNPLYSHTTARRSALVLQLAAMCDCVEQKHFKGTTMTTGQITWGKSQTSQLFHTFYKIIAVGNRKHLRMNPFTYQQNVRIYYAMFVALFSALHNTYNDHHLHFRV
jgi:hypothetical protein